MADAYGMLTDMEFARWMVTAAIHELLVPV